MLNQDAASGGPVLILSEVNFGLFPAVHGRSRIEARFYGDGELIARARAAAGARLECPSAQSLGLVTSGPDALDWDDEIRIALEERNALSPDALTGMEANPALRSGRDAGKHGYSAVCRPGRTGFSRGPTRSAMRAL